MSESMAGETLSDAQKCELYYRAGVERKRPAYVPARVRLHAIVRSDLPWCGAFAEAGEHDCECNQWGAVSVRASDGTLLGVKPAEFEVLRWRKSTSGDATGQVP